jgi:hypothetical protein
MYFVKHMFQEIREQKQQSERGLLMLYYLRFLLARVLEK